MRFDKLDKYRLANNLNIAIEALIANRTRSLLTALGIIFGVAAVISMMAIGRGAKQEILEQIELIGVNNIVITPIIEQADEEVEEDKDTKTESKKFSKGLDLNDLVAIEKLFANVNALSPEVEIQSTAIYNATSRSVRLIGVTNAYFPIANIKLANGTLFSQDMLDKGKAVCIIGSDIRARFFQGQDPVGKHIKIGNEWLKIIGVTERKNITETAISNLGLRNYNFDIYTPIQTVLLRYKDRGKLLAAGGNTVMFIGNSIISSSQDDDKGGKPFNYHQLDKLTVRVENTNQLPQTAEVMERLLKRLHNDVVDFEITIPIQLLEQQQRTKDIFNLVLSIIAGISLLVGGIGIMNIMLASVLERTREIGTRRALGATQLDIISQFLLEAILISLSGGIIGIIVGVVGAISISKLAGILTIISPLSVFVAFGVAFATGLFFGLRPAKRAALQNPIESLRYE